MLIEIKLKNETQHLQIFQNYNIQTIKFMLRENPNMLLEEIERLEREVNPPDSGNTTPIDPPYDINVYI